MRTREEILKGIGQVANLSSSWRADAKLAALIEVQLDIRDQNEFIADCLRTIMDRMPIP